MRTYPILDEYTGVHLAFEIENAYVTPSTIAKLISSVDGVCGLRRRRPFSKWNEVHIWFQYKGIDCIVWEPFGDNSRYWIGPSHGNHALDMRPIEVNFIRYKLPVFREIIGDIITLRFVKRMFGAD